MKTTFPSLSDIRSNGDVRKVLDLLADFENKPGELEETTQNESGHGFPQSSRIVPQVTFLNRTFFVDAVEQEFYTLSIILGNTVVRLIFLKGLLRVLEQDLQRVEQSIQFDQQRLSHYSRTHSLESNTLSSFHTAKPTDPDATRAICRAPMARAVEFVRTQINRLSGILDEPTIQPPPEPSSPAGRFMSELSNEARFDDVRDFLLGCEIHDGMIVWPNNSHPTPHTLVRKYDLPLLIDHLIQMQGLPAYPQKHQITADTFLWNGYCTIATKPLRTMLDKNNRKVEELKKSRITDMIRTFYSE